MYYTQARQSRLFTRLGGLRVPQYPPRGFQESSRIPQISTPWRFLSPDSRQSTTGTSQATRRDEPLAFQHVPSDLYTGLPRKHAGVKKLDLTRKLTKPFKPVNKFSIRHAAKRLARTRAIISRPPPARKSRHPASSPGQVGELQQVLSLVNKDNLGDEDTILLREIAALNLDRSIRSDFLVDRESVDRAERESPQRLAMDQKREQRAEEHWQKEELWTKLTEDRKKLEKERRWREEEERKRAQKTQTQTQEKKEPKMGRGRLRENRITENRFLRQFDMRMPKTRDECERQEQESKAILREARRRCQEAMKKEAEERKQEELRKAEAESLAIERQAAFRERQEREAAARLQEELRRQQEEEERRQEELRQAEAARLAIEMLRVLQEQEAAARQQEELRRQQEEEERRREELRQAEATRQAMEQQVVELRRQYALYDEKWALLKSKSELPPIRVAEFPWPVLVYEGCTKHTPQDRVREFVFQPLRPGMENKSHSARLRMELLKWHTDKFNATILPLIAEDEREIAERDAGEVAKILSLLKEEISS